ncbi:2-amino-4-hydroxy-6-hydroxymethyldihydropteridine diphosphokinase [Pseudomaricurvus alkylphenolicus]|uniref:2-amino-4-hydroxy-6- hydroxymethyldihydropteridine diphosphokinase n=1 Tax=Pseudomaricurvus alkylphenolicus TaxID=1306991 RepID=UPI0014238C16|nr:2-amino-4-hydroxy-6-hydroxymethyldihydropteridine diphosphokinase [Pseudomaricurvus alkylphenolicus]NIB43511.1 2-amino-4-hydroxy-6-hydroxymethyldihydropteridine diphosphokinase [Pseudomaricurvus alkylphenolicus]
MSEAGFNGLSITAHKDASCQIVTVVYVGIGSNLNRESNIKTAKTHIEDNFEVTNLSSVYESEAEGFSGNRFLNIVVEINTNLDKKDLISRLRKIEFDCGRKESDRKYANRSIDIDLLTYGDQVDASGGVCIPRKDILRYAFVLAPLAEVAPNGIHPVTMDTYDRLWSKNRARMQSTWIIDFNWG